ncbi:hypothetical protein LC607_27745 [Nostoc sp. CHAB 5824]|nr:hypothetical protein [Nostoc sp. CHAB 5824]
MTPIAAQVSITAIIPMLSVIANRQWEQFKELEADFVSRYGKRFLISVSSQHWIKILTDDY